MLFLERTNDVASPQYSLIDSDFKLIFSYSSLIGGIYFCRRAGFKILRGKTGISDPNKMKSKSPTFL